MRCSFCAAGPQDSFLNRCGASLATLFWVSVSKWLLFPYLKSQKSFVFVSGFIPSRAVCGLIPPPPIWIRSRTRLPIFPHMFGPGGWSVRIALFIFQWQCAMSNSWWCTKPANPKTRGDSLMWRNLKAKGSALGPKVIPHYHLILSSRGWRGQRYSSWAREMRRVLGPPVGGLQLQPPAPTQTHKQEFGNRHNHVNL